MQNKLKYRIVILSLITFSTLNSCKVNSESSQIIDWNNILSDNEGYLDAKNSKLLLLEINHPISKDSTFYSLSQLSCKYYRTNTKNEFIGCIDGSDLRPYEQTIYFRVKILAGLIIESDFTDFHHGNYNCCTSLYNNLSYHDGYFTIEGCGTGSGFCGKYLVPFYTLDQINWDNCFIIGAESENETGSITLKSEINYKKEYIEISYEMISYAREVDSSYLDKLKINIVCKSKKFQVDNQILFDKIRYL